MIKSAVIISMGTAGIVCFLFPIIVLLYFKKKEKKTIIPVFTGMIVFFVFTQILEKLLYLGVSTLSSSYSFCFEIKKGAFN